MGNRSISRRELLKSSGALVVSFSSWESASQVLLNVQFDESEQKNLDWQSYPVIRFRDVPDIETVLIDRPEMSYLGAGKPSIGPVPAAIGNAVFDAVGVRLRVIPLTPERVLGALKAKLDSTQRL